MAGILVIAGRKCERGVHQIQVHLVEAEFVQTGHQRLLDPFRAMVVVPQLRRHEQLFAADRSVGEQIVERRPDRLFVGVPLGTIQVAKPDPDRGLVTFRVSPRSESSVPNPSAGISPSPLFNANLC
jgi:hypothetical protein